MKECNQVYDLRSALERLRSIPGQLVETDVQVDPAAELAGVYRHVGAGGTVMRPTRSGPAMLFNQIKGHPGALAVFQRRFPMLMKHPMLGAARTITLEQILSVAQAYVPQKKIDETLSELRRA